MLSSLYVLYICMFMFALVWFWVSSYLFVIFHKPWHTPFVCFHVKNRQRSVIHFAYFENVNRSHNFFFLNVMESQDIVYHILIKDRINTKL